MTTSTITGKIKRPLYWNVAYAISKGYGNDTGGDCAKCCNHLKRYPVYDGARRLCAVCMGGARE